MSGSSDNTAATTDPFVKVVFSPAPPSGVDYLFDGLHAHEELGRPFLYKVDLSSAKLNDTSQLVGASCTLTCKKTATDSSPTYYNGIVTRVVSSGILAGTYHYHLELRPWIWLLSRITDCLIFQNKTPGDIITTIFSNAGFSDYSDKRTLKSGSTTVEYIVQYRENSLDFVTRLMEEYGIYYFFTHESGKHTLVLADSPASHTALTNSISFSSDQTAAGSTDDHIWVWAGERSLESAKVTYQDYNFTTPATDLTSKSQQSPSHNQYNAFEVYEYPGDYGVAADGTTLTDVRIQSIGKKRVAYSGSSNVRGLRPGWTFTLSGHPDTSNNIEYLVVEFEFSMTMEEGSSTSQAGGGTVDTYRSEVKSIPSTVDFKLDRKTPRPFIRGPQTAVVAGESGAEIDPDQYGRVKVTFHWDRSPDATSAQPSCWIRVAQTSAGVGWGSMFIPRIGQEVVVTFLEGNPDWPLITGVVYNATNTVPYALPDNKTRSTVKTSSSTGGNGFNEIRFEDKAGSEEVFFQAQKDFTKKVLNNETITIHVDTTTTVETGNRSVTVSQGNETKTVSQGNQSTSISQGNHKLDVTAGKSEVTAGQSITLTVGGNSIKMDTTSLTITIGSNTLKMDPSGITINGSMITSQATGTMSMTGASVSVTGQSSVSVTAPSISLA